MMEFNKRIEQAIERACSSTMNADTPPQLAEASRYALFPGGGRVRPRICMAVAHALGDPHPELTDCAAAALEMIHCASLVHDDLPCFDAAAMRRGRPSVHHAFGEDLAILVGDGLIVAAFAWLARAGHSHPEQAAQIALALGRGTGAGGGIVAGQAWESEPAVNLSIYHQAKTAALFGAATEAGALAAGGHGDSFRQCGLLLGEAYQIADDIADREGDAKVTGKPVGNDARFKRPNTVEQLGQARAVQLLERKLAEARKSIPACAGREELIDTMVSIARRLCPAKVGEVLARV